jgi:ribulose kinase
VSGVWGPYYGAVMPDLWLNEGGQSATGALLDHVLDSHAASAQLGPDRHATMARLLLERRAADPAYASDLLVLPDFHGNRSPLADPALRGSIHGLDLDASLEGLARLYHAAAVGIAYGTRHIVQTLNARGYAISRLHLTGGHAKSPLLVQVYADATGCDVVLPRESDGVLLGTALAAAAAAGVHANLAQAGRAMVADGGRVSPNPATAAVHERGWRAFALMVEQRQALRDVLAG